MPIKHLTLGLSLLLVSSIQAQHQQYRVHRGDTLAKVAKQFNVTPKAILHANGLTSRRLKPGTRLVIPSVGSHESTYVVRNGDFDWAIAKHHGISLRALHQLNGGVDWDALRPGTRLHVPHASSAVAEHTSHSKTHVGHGHLYTVQDGDNDWILAHRSGATLSQLKALNPSVRWSSIHPGQKIRLPGAVADAEPVKRLHSHFAVVAGDNVTIRRGPSRDEDSVTTVDQGTRVAVLDRDGSWYMLRFPKGTVGWVRGDFLHAAAAPHREHHSHMIAYHHTHTHHHLLAHHAREEYVAMDTKAGSNDNHDVLEAAKRMKGVRYRWGEASRSGTDCSGFTLQVFKSQGVKLPRTSGEQSQTGKAIHYGDLRPGDLVFFHTVRGRRVGHVGIYMGDGKFIHASSGKGHVTVNSLADGYYHRRLVGARRVKNAATHHVAKVEHPAKETAQVAVTEPAPDESQASKK